MSVSYSAAPEMRWGLAQGTFTMLAPITATWARPQKAIIHITVPAGFRTDLASIPRIFQNVFPKVGKSITPAIFHDYIYVEPSIGMSKKDADAMFLDGLRHTGMSWLKRRCMWAAVRVGGKGHWG